MSGTSDKDTSLDFRLLNLIATVIEACEHPRSSRRGHPPTATIRVLATLRRFLREGTPWRGLVATEDRASGSTLRRCLARWAETGLLAKVHALLVAMLRGHPDLILDSCSVRAKRGGNLTGPNPTDRGKKGTKYLSRPMVTACQLPASPRRPMSMTRSPSSGCSWPPSRSWPVSGPCSQTKATTLSTIAICAAPLVPSPASTSAANRAGRDWANIAGRSSAAMPGCSKTDASPCAMTGSASSSTHCFRPPAYSWLQPASPANSENRSHGHLSVKGM